MAKNLSNKSPPVWSIFIAKMLFSALLFGGVILLCLPQLGYHVDIVLSGSMEPCLKTGALVFTDVSQTDPDTGDIIQYQTGGARVTHRVIKKNSKGYITKGDANDTEDAGTVESRQILGTVVGTIPYLGYLIMFLKQKTVLGILLFMILQEMILLFIQWKGERRKHCAEK